MKTIEISFRRQVTYHKIVEVSDKVAKRALKLDGEDLNEPPSGNPLNDDFYFITEELTDCVDDVNDYMGEIDLLEVREYKPKPKK